MQTRTAFLAALALSALASAQAAAGAKKYFLTPESFPATQALEACGKGYHMAALWEIFDVSLLKYDTKRGEARADSGPGPAAELFGWIRTGFGASVDNTPGAGNCSAWTSSLVTDYGSMVELNGHWDDPAVAASPWSPATATCDSTLPVWCKQN